MNAQAEIESVQHLLELGYEDPLEAAARTAALHQQRDQQFKQSVALLDTGQVDQAIELLEHLAAEWPDWAAPRRRLGSVYVTARRFSLARQHLQWLTYHGFESASLALLQAQVELGQRQFDFALDQAQYAKCLDGSVVGADAIVGQVHLRRGKLTAAEDAFRQELEIRPDDAAALAGMAALALRRGEYESAIDWALQSLEKNMNQPTLHYCLGVALARFGRPAEARVALETATQLDANLAAPYRWLARLSKLADDDSQCAVCLAAGRSRIHERRMRRRKRDGRSIRE